MTPAIAFDARMVGMGGIGRYTESLLAEMIRQRPRFRWILIGDPARLKKLSAIADVGALKHGVEIRECRARIYSFEEAFGMVRFFDGADLVHVPHFNAPTRCRAKLVVTLHDLIHFEFPEYQPFPFANLLLDWKIRTLLNRADGVLTVSSSTAETVKRRYASAGLEQKIKVVWEGADAVFDPAPKPDDRARLKRLNVRADRPYVLYVGAIREHKEVHVLADAFEAMRRNHPELLSQLVLCGRLDGRFDRKRNFSQRIRESDEITHIADAADEDLPALYRHAAVLVMPSRAEGFGLPVVEAMRSGTAVIISDIPVLREVAGPAPMTFCAGDRSGLADCLRRVLGDAVLRAELKEKSLDRGRVSGLFEWARTAEQTLGLYEEILGRP